jgi:transcriptional regulator with XRE-family HTH domain
MSDTNLTENLRAAMAKRGITIKDAARMCGIHADTLERLFGGRTRKIDAQMIDRIAACAALRRNDWHDRHRFVAEVFDLPLAPETTRKLDFQIEVLMARVAQLEGGQNVAQADEPDTQNARVVDNRVRTE